MCGDQTEDPGSWPLGLVAVLGPEPPHPAVSPNSNRPAGSQVQVRTLRPPGDLPEHPGTWPSTLHKLVRNLCFLCLSRARRQLCRRLDSEGKEMRPG